MQCFLNDYLVVGVLLLLAVSAYYLHDTDMMCREMKGGFESMSDGSEMARDLYHARGLAKYRSVPGTLHHERDAVHSTNNYIGLSRSSENMRQQRKPERDALSRQYDDSHLHTMLTNPGGDDSFVGGCGGGFAALDMSAGAGEGFSGGSCGCGAGEGFVGGACCGCSGMGGEGFIGGAAACDADAFIGGIEGLEGLAVKSDKAWDSSNLKGRTDVLYLPGTTSKQVMSEANMQLLA